MTGVGGLRLSGAARALPLCAALACVAIGARAQNVAPSGEIQPGETRPLPEAPLLPHFDFRIEAPRPSPVPRAVEELTFTVRDIHVVGASKFKPDSFRPLYRSLLGKSIHLSDVIHVAEAIEAKYRADGYVLTRAYVPAQSVSNGVFTIRVVEGYVAAVSVTGGTENTRRRIEHILAPIPASRPLRLDVIEDALLRANNLPGVGVSGLLRPSSTEPGASDLVATISSQRVTTILSIDNRGAVLTDVWTASAEVAIRSPFNDGGLLLLDVAAAPEQPHIRNSFSGKYIYPLTDGGLLLTLSALDSHGQPAGDIAGADFVSDNQAYGVRLSYPLLVTRASTLTLDGGFTLQNALLHEPSLAIFDHDQWREVDVALVYQQNGFLNGVTTATLDVTQGLDILGASPANDPNVSHLGAVPDFTKLSGVVRRIQQIFGPLSFAFTGTGQYAFQPLYVGEEISFGGAQIGRGYDPAAITGDIGVGGDAELRYTLDVSGRHIDSPNVTINHAELYAYYDAAKVWNHDGPVTPNYLASAGFGGRTIVDDKLQLGLEMAFPQVRVPTSDYDKKAIRILFNGSVKF